LLFEYKGEEHQRFYHLVKHLFNTLDIQNYHIYRGKDKQIIQVFIEVDHLCLQQADTKRLEISNALKQKLTKKWKSLPSSSLPEDYNIVTLPYQKI